MKKTVIPHSLLKMNIFNSCIDPSPVIKYLDIINVCVYLISFMFMLMHDADDNNNLNSV